MEKLEDMEKMENMNKLEDTEKLEDTIKMDFTKTCFWCGVATKHICRECQLVGVCGEKHLQIHRPSEYCQPFAVEHSDEKGNLLVAVRDIKPFETVLVDKPVLIGPFTDTCLSCHLPLTEPCHPCAACSLPLCGESCKDGQLHQQECLLIRNTKEIDRQDIVDLFSAVGVIRMLMRMNDDAAMCEVVLRLMDHLAVRRREDGWVVVTDHLVPWVMSLGITNSSPELIERIVGIIRTNSVKWAREREGGGGYAVCPIFSVLNHSCVNNTVDTQTLEGSLLVRATMVIRQGEEIFTQYRGPTQGNVQRRKDLLDYWKFCCTCIRCNDPTELGTMTSGVKCAHCGGTVLPISADMDSQWRCLECYLHQPAAGVLATVDRLQCRLELMVHTANPEEWEDLLTEFQTELHENHFLCMNVKRVLISMYGAREGYLLQQLPRKLIERKIELCNNYLDIFSRLEPGYRQWKGEVLEELIGALTVSTNQDMENNNITKIHYIKRIKEIITLTKEAAKCRQFEDPKKANVSFYQALAASFGLDN